MNDRGLAIAKKASPMQAIARPIARSPIVFVFQPPKMVQRKNKT